MFGWRRFGNRRELAWLPGPGADAVRQRRESIDQGISKAGNRRVRGMMVELAWRVAEPAAGQCSDPYWFNRRFAAAGTHAPGGHRGGGAASGHRAAALIRKMATYLPARPSSRSPLELGRLRSKHGLHAIASS